MLRLSRNCRRITLTQLMAYFILTALLLALCSAIWNSSRKLDERTDRRPPAEHHGSFAAENDTLRGKVANASRRLPDALIVGVKEGGTSELIAMLRTHSEIAAPTKELNFFDEENYSRGIDWYRKRMPLARISQVVVEEDPTYFSSERAAEKIYKIIPKAKIILVVRDPIKRLMLDYEKQKLVKSMPALEEVVTYQADDGSTLVNLNEPIVRLSQYDDDFLKITRYFTAERILVLSGERLMQKPWLELERIQSFLGVGLEIREEHFVYDEDSGDVCLHNTLTGPCIIRQSAKLDLRQDVLGLLKEYFSPRIRRFQLLSEVDFTDEWFI